MMRQPELPERKKVIQPRPKVEHGDWRVTVKNPATVLYQQIPPLSLWKRLHLRVEYLQNVPATGYGYVGFGVEEQLDIRGWARFVRLCIGAFVLLPLSIVLTYALMLVLYSIGVRFSLAMLMQTPIWYTLLGAACFLIIHYSRVAKSLLVYSYVIGHELTHGLAALMCLGKIHQLKIDSKGGYVETDKNNFFIGLAPYFLPLWMLLWVGLVSLAALAMPFEGSEQLLYGGLGFWWAFHIYWTLWILPREQPDLLENGLFFSSLLIWMMNLLVLIGILLTFGLVSWASCGGALAASVEHLGRFLEVLYVRAQGLRYW